MDTEFFAFTMTSVFSQLLVFRNPWNSPD